MAPVEGQVIAWTAAFTSSPVFSVSLLILFLSIIIIFLSVCASCYSYPRTAEVQQCLSSRTQKVSQCPDRPLEKNSTNLSYPDENSVSTEQHRCTWEPQTRPNPPVRSLTLVANYQAKTPSHNRGLSHGFFSEGLTIPEYDRFSQIFQGTLEPANSQTGDRTASVSPPTLLNQTRGHYMHGFKGTDNMVYNSTEHETDAIQSHSAHHIYSEPELEDGEDHLYACIREADASDFSLPHSRQEIRDEAFETRPEDEDDMEHSYECIRGTNVTDAPRPRSCAQAEESEPAEDPYQTVREPSQAVGTAEPAVGQSEPSLLVPPTLSDTREPGLIGTGRTVVYAAINWKNKSRYRKETTVPSASNFGVSEDKEEGEDVTEPAPPIPEKHFIE